MARQDRNQEEATFLPHDSNLMEHRMRVVNRLPPEAPGYGCSKCGQKFDSPVKIRHHQVEDCPGEPGAFTAKTSRFATKGQQKE